MNEVREDEKVKARKREKIKTTIGLIFLSVTMCSFNTLFLISSCIDNMAYIWVPKAFCYFTWISSLIFTACSMVNICRKKFHNVFLSVTTAIIATSIVVFIDQYCFFLEESYTGFFNYFIENIVKITAPRCLLYIGVSNLVFLITIHITNMLYDGKKSAEKFKARIDAGKKGATKIDAYKTLTFIGNMLAINNETPFVVAVENSKEELINVIMTGNAEERRILLKCMFASHVKLNKREGMERSEAFDEFVSKAAVILDEVYNEDIVSDDFDINNFIEGD